MKIMCSLSCTSVHYLSLVVLSSCNADQKLFCRQMQYVIVSTHFYADPTFLEPFGLVFLIFAIGLEWGGFPTIALYMVPFLK